MNNCLPVICISFIALVLLPSPAAAECCGFPEEIASVPQDILEFATRELKSASNGGLQKCAIEPVGTFTEQVVAGWLYRFDLKIQSNRSSSLTCPISETCHIAVRSQPWMIPAMQVLEAAPDNTRESCDKYMKHEIAPIPQKIMDFATRTLRSASNGRLQNCAIELVGTSTEQVGTGKWGAEMLYGLDLKIQRNLGSSLPCPISETCHFAVRSQPQPQPWMHPPALELLDGSLDNNRKSCNEHIR